MTPGGHNNSSPLARRAVRGCTILLAAAMAATGGRAAAQTPPTAQLPPLTFAATETLDSSQGIWLRKIYGEALRRIGYRLVYQVYPTRRASAMVDNGVVDGEIHRAQGYGEVHPNLVRVPVSHFASTFAAYGRAPLSLPNGWQSLAASRLRVEYRAGVVYCEQMLPQVVPAQRLSTVYAINLGLRKLQHGRTDVYVDEDRFVDLMLQRAEFKAANIVKLATLETVEAYTYLNRRHARLAPQLGEALSAMKREGLIERYRRQAYGDRHQR